jgi:hypothetical protein
MVQPMESTAALQIVPTLRPFASVILPGATVRQKASYPSL